MEKFTSSKDKATQMATPRLKENQDLQQILCGAWKGIVVGKSRVWSEKTGNCDNAIELSVSSKSSYFLALMFANPNQSMIWLATTKSQLKYQNMTAIELIVFHPNLNISWRWCLQTQIKAWLLLWLAMTRVSDIKTWQFQKLKSVV